MEIRKARISDSIRIKELYEELDLHSIRNQPEHFQKYERTVEFVNNLINNNDSDFLLCIIEHNVIGFSLLLQKEVKGLSLLIPCKYAYIQDFMISDNFRNNGYGTNLFQASKKWAQDHNCEYLRLSVIPSNEAGVRFYKKNGMLEQMITMECRIL